MKNLKVRHGTGTEARHGTARAVPCRTEIKNYEKARGTCLCAARNNVPSRHAARRHSENFFNLDNFWQLNTGVLIRTFGFSDNSARLGQNSLGSAFGRTSPQIWLGHLSDNRTVRTSRLLFRTLGPSRLICCYFGHSARSDSSDKAEPSY